MAELAPDDPRRALFCQTGFDGALQGTELTDVGDGTVTATLTVQQPVQNMVGTLHGGAIATLVDVVGTVAIMSADQDGRPGVTTDLNVSYFAAGKPGDHVTITCATT